MARHKHVDLSPRFLAADLEKQLLPVTGTTPPAPLPIRRER